MGKRDRVLVIGHCLMGAVICSFGLVHAARLPVRVYTTADGLPRNRITAILEDPRGFLWVGTPDGLARFDGEAFVTYGVADGLPSSQIWSLLSAHDGTLWVGTPSGLCRLRPSEQAGAARSHELFEVVRPTLPHAITCLLEDRRGRLWFGTDEGVFRLREMGGAWAVESIDFGLPTDPHQREVREILEDRRGDVWVSVGSHLVHVRENGFETLGAAEGFSRQGQGVGSVAEDSSERLWVVSGGLARLVAAPRLGAPAVEQRFTGAPYTAGLAPGGDLISTLLPRRDGGVWVGAGLDGLWSMSQEGTAGRWRTQYHDLIPGTQTEVQVLAEDRAGNLWVGTSALGLVMLAREGFETFDASDGLVEPCVGLFESRAGALCAASKRAISCFDGHRFHPVRLELPARIAYMGWGWNQVTLQDHTGELWVPTGEGLCRFPALARSPPLACYTRKNGLPSDNVFRLYEDRNGDVWVGLVETQGSGLGRWDRTTERVHVFDEVAQDWAPTAFAEDPAGGLWIAFWNGGIVRYASGSFRRFPWKPEADRVLSLDVDRAGRLWAGTSRSGLMRCDEPLSAKPVVHLMTTKDGLASDAVRDVIEDRSGRIWAYTAHGLDRIDPVSGAIRHYGHADGLPSAEGGILTIDRNGALWAATGTTISRLAVGRDAPASAERPRILALRMGEVAVPVSAFGELDVAGLELGSDRRSVEIEYASLGSLRPPRYQYRLEGAERAYSGPVNVRKVAYPYLPPGRYRFAVRAIDSEGTSTADSTVSFRILPPFWQRSWFLALGGSIFLLGILGFQRQRVRRLLELERIRTRIATDLHDDIGASLSRMAILSEVVRRRIEPQSPESGALLGQVANSARTLVDSMSDIVWSLDPRRDDLGQLIARIRECAAETLAPAGIAWSFTAPPDPGAIPLRSDPRRHLYLIFKEALHNVVKHSGAKTVTMSIEQRDGGIGAEIRDDGRGFEQGGTPRAAGGNGLRNMRARADQAGGRLEVESGDGLGTRLVLQLPLA